MTSETQERMLAILTVVSWPALAAMGAKWEVPATVIGTVKAPAPDVSRPKGSRSPSDPAANRPTR
jgi:phosphoribosylformylglycinamidine (FGAM) synthase-like enzyme